MNSRAAVTLAVLLLAATSCGDRSGAVKAGVAPAEAPSATTAADRPSPPAGMPGVQERRRSDADLVRTFVAFAMNPTPRTAAALPSAPAVRLGLSRDLAVTLHRSTLAQPGSWSMEPAAGHLRGHVGAFSALELLAGHAERVGSRATAGRSSAFTVSVGDHPHCAAPPVPAPRGLVDRHRVSLQPSGTSIDGCLSWFTVDLFLDGAGRITAVTLDIWEP